MVRAELYTPSAKKSWDKFILGSRNGTFLFFRDYMDYHADRFQDHSLLFYQDHELLAVLPANVRDAVVSSHGGLTYGGLVTGPVVRTALILDLFEVLKSYLRSTGITKLVYKPVPHIYHTCPAEEDLYALFRCNATLARRDVSSTIRMGRRIRLSKGRKWAIGKAKEADLKVIRSHDFHAFMTIEEQLLREKYGTRPTHTPEEMELLASRFPENIKLFAALEGETLVAGVVVFETAAVAHAQYIAASERGKELGCVDLIIDSLLKEQYPSKDYFDFGISTEQDGRYLNEGLIANKESYGARAVVYDHYHLDLAAG